MTLTPNNLWITGVNPANPIVWTGIPQEVCYKLTTNVNPKQLRLYKGDASSGVYLIRAISAGATLSLPTASQSCVPITFSSGLPVATYTLVLEERATKTPRAATRLHTATASVFLSRFLRTNAKIDLTAKWRVDPAHASPRDRVEVLNARTGERVDWAYTSCRCKGPPGPQAAPSGTLVLRVPRGGGCGPRGYTVRLVSGRGGGKEVVAVGFEWIDWAKLCRT